MLNTKGIKILARADKASQASRLYECSDADGRDAGLSILSNAENYSGRLSRIATSLREGKEVDGRNGMASRKVESMR